MCPKPAARRDRRFLREARLRSALYLSTDGRCARCGDPLSPGWHADHVIPWIRSRTTDIDQMQPLCPTCNLRKGARA